jgi:hypothetical protein
MVGIGGVSGIDVIGVRCGVVGRDEVHHPVGLDHGVQDSGRCGRARGRGRGARGGVNGGPTSYIGGL